MINIDVIILSYAKNEYLLQVTKDCINSLINSSNNFHFNIIIFESEKSIQPYQYEFTQTFYLDEEFNYNKFMNVGASLGNADYIVFCNNDLEFTENWCENLISAMQNHNLDSASPYCNRSLGIYSGTSDIVFGNQAGKTMLGWCITMKRSFFDRIGGFDDCVRFYCSDNVYSEQLKKNDGKHALITTSIVRHLAVNLTVSFLDDKTREELTVGETKKFNRLFNQNIFGYGND
jgi:GT2 family glycosyltransferase